ncbi:MAG: tetratricopeptide repeat protein [Sphingobacteriaceae bacterium]|nr:tetratricopeptide repeat protein [Sphingobacteriaceae bacterium]
MKFNLRIVCVAVLFLRIGLHAQDGAMDSLKLALKNAKHDTIRCHILNVMIEAESDDNIWPLYNEQLKKLSEQNLITSKNNKVLYKFYLRVFGSTLNNIGYLAQVNGDLPRAIEYLDKSMKIQEEIGDKAGYAQSLNNIGIVYHTQGNISKELECFLNSVMISHEVGDKVSEANGINNIGAIYKSMGDIPKALDYYRQSLKLLEELGDKKGVAQAINNIALIYDDLGDFNKGMEYHLKSLKIREEISHKKGIAESLNNIGYMYFTKGDSEKAMEYYLRALKIYEDVKSNSGISSMYGNIGSVYERKGDFSSALQYYEKNIKIDEEIGDKHGVSVMLKRMSSSYFHLKDYNKALQLALRSMKISQELGYPESLKSGANILYKIYKAKGDSKNAFLNYKLFNRMQDSLNNQEIQKASIRSQFKIEYDRKEKQARLEQEKKDLISAEEKQKQIMIRNSFIGGFSMVLILAIVILKGFIQNKKKNKVIEAQKLLVEMKQKEIVDSIYYAQRIQKALMPNEKYFEKTLNKLRIKD